MELFITVPLIVLSLFGIIFSSFYIYEKITEEKKTPFK